MYGLNFKLPNANKHAYPGGAGGGGPAPPVTYYFLGF